MRTPTQQIKIQEPYLKSRLKKLKTNINYFEDMLKKEDYKPSHYAALAHAATEVLMELEKYDLLQMMVRTTIDTDVYPNLAEETGSNPVQ